MKFTLRTKSKSLKGNIILPASKSISNRVLIIQALTKTPFNINNLSTADDTVIMQKALDRNDMITDVGPAGTAMRFLTAYYAGQPGEKVLTGSERMKQRPISILVDALRSLGARITYLENEGFPPLHIEGRRLNGGHVKVAGNVSSQFITALLLIAPTLPQPLHIDIEGDPLSRPYIGMTKSLMESCGAQLSFEGNQIVVQPGRYRSKAYTVEQDWSSAAFWMSFATLARKVNFTLLGLTENSIQGDRAATAIFEKLGLKFQFNETGLGITKSEEIQDSTEWNFRNHPDLVQPAVISAGAQGLKFSFHGLDNLRLKESDRIFALQSELKKAGIESEVNDHTLTLVGNKPATECEEFDAHSDHRMVMSVAALSMIYPVIKIHDPMVVAKSYPEFWKEVEKFVDVRPNRS
ncbi:MAG TPA: 3-phosphoshikimate 1-carboxyvinyltransferase [Flavobacteriales bacterium]|jgi:3-phosphoshikimate 1-carboxyvinyltransferase|nr:3-phosphoshikimate 1-carboxyvinyltransferase [Flavobacteriales bacterium]HAW18718.1 3-phosphoshikimate 1-carboxyvinyltransferase [Flavobacteriales bacterium]